ncbi:hypothetical protein ACFY3U_15320 [Micromonospora sp. NPDC000089]|uniref:hypothetical protein n=1 Tax=unclassified Micromonospora TaxID=2617518 RepID=UPI0036AEB7B9
MAVAALLTGCTATDPGTPAPSSSVPVAGASPSAPATAPPSASAPTATAPGAATPSGPATGANDPAAGQVVLVRTGGFAGRTDMVTVEPNGRWTVATKGGKPRTGQLSPADLDRLRALARTAGQAGPAPSPRCADTYTYRLTAPTGTAIWTDCPTGPKPPAAATAAAQLLLKATATG